MLIWYPRNWICDHFLDSSRYFWWTINLKLFLISLGCWASFARLNSWELTSESHFTDSILIVLLITNHNKFSKDKAKSSLILKHYNFLSLHCLLLIFLIFLFVYKNFNKKYFRKECEFFLWELASSSKRCIFVDSEL